MEGSSFKKITKRIFAGMAKILLVILVIEGIFLIFKPNVGGQCGKFGFVGDPASGSSDHCDCFGLKVFRPFGYFSIIDVRCLGFMNRWGESNTSFISFMVYPRNSSGLIESASSSEEPNSLVTKRVVINNFSEFFAPNPPYQIQIDRGYTYSNEKIEFHDKSPLHIEISHPGYKPWIADIIPKTNPIEIKVKLEHE